MASGGKDREEETLQTAFKKLRVDAESKSTAAHACEALAPRAVARANTEGVKPKSSCPKEYWHGCVRKSSRGGASRSGRRRRSKSPVLHPPKFTYCPPRQSPPPGRLKHKPLSAPAGGSDDNDDPASSSPGIPAKKELLSPGHSSPAFGRREAAPPVAPEGEGPPPGQASDDESGADLGGTAGGPSPADFRSLSRQREGGEGCPCAARGECRCPGWRGVEVYSFTGLRDVISECERNLGSTEDAASSSARTQSGAGTSESPRSCSEQARAYVDDITIEDLSGYMEYYLYIPKKMSHMAEMMYT